MLHLPQHHSVHELRWYLELPWTMPAGDMSPNQGLIQCSQLSHLTSCTCYCQQVKFEAQQSMHMSGVGLEQPEEKEERPGAFTSTQLLLATPQ
ncbi:hypothetical protein Y1Q_0005151 [Alligator mississippiensis]|uniref:Uncharacterized protein n=1 Tax=Alligator mississippiensis TaxID=8496 RepID=A0A151MSS5_ALLMI|nr:hypothetical protein Y1Q_0005151 [Alligator mississippiensis]